MLISVINESGEEPQGHAFPDPVFRIGVGCLVVGAELTGEGLFEIGFAYIIVFTAYILAIQLQGPITLRHGVYLDLCNILG